MISAGMSDDKTVKWSDGLPFVQFMKNHAFHLCIKQTPYKAMLGNKHRVELTTSSSPNDVISPVEREEDLKTSMTLKLT